MVKFALPAAALLLALLVALAGGERGIEASGVTSVHWVQAEPAWAPEPTWTPVPVTGPIYPVADLGIGCVLGGVSNKQFVPDPQASAYFDGGERYRIYGLKGLLDRATGTKPGSEGPPCEDVNFLSTTPSYKEKEVIALGGTWPGMPRVPVALGNNLPVYKQAVADLLKSRGIDNPKINITQVLRIDLEGDRTDEVLVSASYFKDGWRDEQGRLLGPAPSAAAGDYSIAFMRKVVAGKVQTVVLDEGTYPAGVEFAAPVQYKVRGVVDVNGDGTMEVIVYGMYYEGHWSSVYQIKGTRVEEVLACGCGA